MNIDRLRKKQEEINKRKEGYRKDFWFPKEGPNEIRILPHWSCDLEADCWYETAYHKNIGEEKKSVICLKFEKKEPCPVCEAIEALWKTKQKEDAAFAKTIKMQIRVYWNIVDLKDLEKGVQVWMTGTDVLDQVIDYCTNPKFGDITNPETGRNITLKFTPGEKMKSGYNDYVVQPDPPQTMVQPEWLEKMTDLTTFVKITPYDEVKAILWGEEKAETPAPAPAGEPKPETPKPEAPKPEKQCVGKFRDDDEDCLTCGVKENCKVKTEEKKVKPASAPATPSEPTPVPPAPSASTADKKTEVENMLKKIREKQGKK